MGCSPWGRKESEMTSLSLSLLAWQSPRLKGGAEAIKGRSQAVGTPLSQQWMKTFQAFPGPHLRAQRSKAAASDSGPLASTGPLLQASPWASLKLRWPVEQASASQLVVAYNASPSNTGIFAAFFTLPHWSKGEIFEREAGPFLDPESF